MTKVTSHPLLGAELRGKTESSSPTSPLLHTLNCTTLPVPREVLEQGWRDASLLKDFSQPDATSRANINTSIRNTSQRNQPTTNATLATKEPGIISQTNNILTTLRYWRRSLSTKSSPKPGRKPLNRGDVFWNSPQVPSEVP